MHTSYCSSKNNGFAIIEIVLAVSLLGMIVTGMIGALTYAQQGTSLSGDRSRAAFFAKEGLEAVRNIRDANFSNLVDGTYGLSTTSNQWQFVGAQDVFDIFTRKIMIATINVNTKSITSEVTWTANAQRTGSVSLLTHMTNWARASTNCVNQATCLMVNSSSIALQPGNPLQVNGPGLSNSGTSSIAIANIILTWTGGASGNNSQSITINGVSVWSGNSKSADILTLSGSLAIPGGGTVIAFNSIRFKKTITGGRLQITFTMADGSTKALPSVQL